MNSVLTKSQAKAFRKELSDGSVLVVHVRYDDQCGNGHNTFSITANFYNLDYIRGEAYLLNSKGKKRYLGSCGCQHDLVAEHFPELARYIKWHLTSSGGPLHYVANTIYWATNQNGNGPNLKNARSRAIWPDATLAQLSDRATLEARLPALLEEFRRDIESLGFVW